MHLLLFTAALLAPGAAAAKSPLPAEMRSFIRNELGIVDYRAAAVDLDGDRRVEGVIYDRSPDSCGTGGCRLVVVSCGSDGGCRTVMERSVMRLPIRVLATRTSGWRDLSAMQYGGGFFEPATVRLSVQSPGREDEMADPVEMAPDEDPGRVLIAR